MNGEKTPASEKQPASSLTPSPKEKYKKCTTARRSNSWRAKNFHGKTPADYFRSFKRVVRSATKDGYFSIHPAGDVQSQTNASEKLKEFLEANEYIKLIAQPLDNHEVMDAFIFSCYTGLRWCDVKNLKWKQIKNGVLVTTIIQQKTGRPVELTLHPIAKKILDNRNISRLQNAGRQQKQEVLQNKTVFALPTANGANKAVTNWVKRAGINKFITWSCARLSFSILLQDALTDQATVALLLGHTTTRYVNETYKRHRPKDQTATIAKLPAAEWNYD